MRPPEPHHPFSPAHTKQVELSGEQRAHSGPIQREAAQAQTSLSVSSASPPAHHHGYSGYGVLRELPLLPSAPPRNSSLPTFRHCRVASPSPQQRTVSMASPARSCFALPPIQDVVPAADDDPSRASLAKSRSLSMPSHDPFSETASAPSLQPAATRQLDPIETVLPIHSEIQTILPPPHLIVTSSDTHLYMDDISSPAHIKQEPVHTPQASPPIQPHDGDSQTLKTLSTLKNEHGLRTNSPLREASVPVPSTEMPAAEQVTNPRKRPAPSKTKKGTATSTGKKAAPLKRRKLEPQGSATPSSRASKPSVRKGGSGIGTPATSSPAPSARSYSADPNEEPYDDDDEEGEEGDDDDREGDGDLYCICRKPDSGTFMIGCDGTCDDWFHGKCVGIEERDKNLIDKYICPNCIKKNVGQTMWKRMCRRGGCRQPARAAKAKADKGSKYCSDECGVLFYRRTLEGARGRVQMAQDRSSRRRGNAPSSQRPAGDDDLGARGGVLAAGEIKGLLNVSKTAKDFQKLGEGVLSPPTTPDGKTESADRGFSEGEVGALRHVTSQKEEARARHQLLKDRMQFVTMAKQAASRTAAEKELKPKDYCGYDPRLEWTEERFSAWRHSAPGRQAFDLRTLATDVSPSDPVPSDAMLFDPEDDAAEPAVCDRKKCARHVEWGKLAVDDVRFEMGDNSMKMHLLNKEEKGIRERAALRLTGRNARGDGAVEFHGLALPDTLVPDSMEVDEPGREPPPAPFVDAPDPSEPAAAVPDPEAMAVDAAV